MAQYEAEDSVSFCDRFIPPVSLPDEIAILTSPEQDDAQAESFLSTMADIFGGRTQKRPIVHLLLQHQSTLRRLQVSDFDPHVNEVFEVFPFTMEEAWAENVVVRLPGIGRYSTQALDREPITADSRQIAHFVIAGFDSYAESLAIKAAQVAHFPNYDGKAEHPLRTRITIIAPGITTSKDAFISRYHNLFDNSYYRTVKLDGQKSDLHHPIYEGSREDFVDIEWEFVDGTLNNPIVVGKLEMWATDPGQQLTLAVSGPDDNANVDSAMALPDAILDRGIPVWVRVHVDYVTKTLGQSPKYRGIIPFGMDRCGHDISLPVMQMAKLLHYFYTCSYGTKGTPISYPQEEVDAEWRKVGSFKMRFSNVCNVLTMATKMHSLGHDDRDLSTFYALSEEEIGALARTEHNRWCVERLISGTRACTDEERAAIRNDIKLKREYKARDIHYDLCAYDELGVDDRGVDVRTYDYTLTACIPLIVESYLKEAGR